MSVPENLKFLPYFKYGFSQNASYQLLIQKVTDAGLQQHDTAITKSFELQGPESVKSLLPTMIVSRYPKANQQEVEINYFPYIVFKDPDFPWRYSVINETDPSRTIPWVCLLVFSEEEYTEADCATSVVNNQKFLTVNSGSTYLPDHNSLWSTAHIQLKEYEEGEYLEYMENYPENSLSRLLCLKKLEGGKNYRVFLVPTFQAALYAHFPEMLAAGPPDQTEPLWESGSSMKIEIPIYDEWRFTTNDGGDFESLLNKIEPRLVDPRRVGTLPVNISYRKTDGTIEKVFFKREGALAAPDFHEDRTEFYDFFLAPDPANSKFYAQEELKNSLNENLRSTIFDNGNPRGQFPVIVPAPDNDPLISYPVYGKYYRRLLQIEYQQAAGGWPGTAPWLNELNLDIRNRWASALGTTVIQRNQDGYAKRCWEQVGDVRTANEKIRKTKSALEIQQALYNKHFSKLGNTRSLFISSNYHQNIPSIACGSPTTLKAGLAQSRFPPGTFSYCFQRMLSTVALLDLDIVQADGTVYEPVDVSIAPPSVGLAGGGLVVGTISDDGGFQGPVVVGSDNDQPVDDRPGDDTVPVDYIIKNVKEALGIDLVVHDNLPEEKKEQIPYCPDIEYNKGKEFLAFENVKQRTVNRLRRLLGNHPKFEEVRGLIVMGPVIKDPMYEKLRDESVDYIIPGLDKIPHNSAVLMEENRRFIESYMVGLNHEMVRELVWREFPTTRNITVFSHFWDNADLETLSDDEDAEEVKPTDIDPILTWKNNLGRNKTKDARGRNVNRNQDALLVFILKADLVRRYPNLVVYAMRSDTELTRDTFDPENVDGLRILFYRPIFKAEITEDTIGIGFSLTKQDLEDAHNAGQFFYFAVQENYNLLKFGLDIFDPEEDIPREGPVDSINDLHWDLVVNGEAGINGLNTGKYLSETFILGSESIFDKEYPEDSSEVYSSSVANNTLQLPNLGLFKAEDLLLFEEP